MLFDVHVTHQLSWMGPSQEVDFRPVLVTNAGEFVLI